MSEYIFCVPDENQPIAGDSSVYYPDERDEPMCVREEIVRCRDCKHYEYAEVHRFDGARRREPTCARLTGCARRDTARQILLVGREVVMP